MNNKKEEREGITKKKNRVLLSYNLLTLKKRKEEQKRKEIKKKIQNKKEKNKQKTKEQTRHIKRLGIPSAFFLSLKKKDSCLKKKQSLLVSLFCLYFFVL